MGVRVHENQKEFSDSRTFFRVFTSAAAPVLSANHFHPPPPPPHCTTTTASYDLPPFFFILHRTSTTPLPSPTSKAPSEHPGSAPHRLNDLYAALFQPPHPPFALLLLFSWISLIATLPSICMFAALSPRLHHVAERLLSYYHSLPESAIPHLNAFWAGTHTPAHTLTPVTTHTHTHYLAHVWPLDPPPQKKTSDPLFLLAWAPLK